MPKVEKGILFRKYSPKVIKQAQEYLSQWNDLYETFTEEVIDRNLGVISLNKERAKSIPSKVGLARHLNVSRRSIYDWEKHQRFSDVLEQLQQIQEIYLIHHGLTKGYSTKFAEFICDKLTTMKIERVEEEKQIIVNVTAQDK